MTENINEDTVGSNAQNIETTDENLSVDLMFQQNQIPSLGRQIFSVVPINGPTGALFNILKKSDIAEVTTVLCEADTLGSLNDKYWTLSSTTIDYYVWYNVNTAGALAPIAGKTAIEVALSTDASIADVGDATQAAIHAIGGAGVVFTATDDDAGLITITNTVVGAVTIAADGDTGWTDAWTVTTTGAIVNEFELLRNEVGVYPSSAIKTALTQEAVEDLKSQHNKEANIIIGNLLRGLANDAENVKTLAFLAAQAKASSTLALTTSSNAETNLFEITHKVSELVLEMNKLNLRTYEACVVLPYKVAASIMALSQYAGGEDENTRGLFIAQINQTKFFTNPDSTSLTAYVILKDSANPSKSSAIFSPYVAEIIEANDPNSGSISYHIYNRYAITASPLHITDNEMIYSFAITL